MKLPLAIIIAGPSGTGKTTLGKRLAQDLTLPLLYKDGIKEILFDYLGWSDREWSRKLGRTSIELLFYFAKVQLQARQSFIIESNFTHEYATPQFNELQEKYPFEPFQIQCVCDGPTLLQRFKDRATSSERHPGHVESANLDEFAPYLLKGRHEPLEVGGTLYEIDTTDFTTLNSKGYRKLLELIRASL